MVAPYRKQTNWIDDGMYDETDNDRFPEPIQKRIEEACRRNGWALNLEDCRQGKPMGPGCGIGRGWLPVLVELDRQLAEIDPDYRLAQVKEKFGGLRYYFDTDLEGDKVRKMYDLVTEAENACAGLCEICGSTGKLIGGRWLTTRCEEHAGTR